MIRAFVWFIIVVAFVVIATTVKFGKRTLWGHAKAIWSTEEAKDAREGIKEKAGPVVKDVKEKAKRALEDDDKPDAAPAVKPAPASKW